MGLRRKATGRREPRFDAFPIPGLGLRLTASDRLVGLVPDESDDADRPPVARKGRHVANEEPVRPRPRREEDQDGARTPRKSSGDGGGKRRSTLGRLSYWGLVLGLWGVIAAAGVLVWTAAHLPAIQSLEVPSRPPAIQILGLNGHTLATRGDMGGAAVALKDLPPF